MAPITLPILLLAAAPPAVSAGTPQPEVPPPPAPSAREQVVREELQRATALFATRDYMGALAAYRLAEPLLRSLPERGADLATVRLNTARCLDELNQPGVIAAYRDALRVEQPEPQRLRAQRRLEALIAASYGGIEVRCKGFEATVALEEQPGFEAACDHVWDQLDPGWYTIVARDTRDRLQRERVQVSKGRALVVPFGPIAEPAPPPPDRVLAWALTVGAGAALAGGLAYNLLARADLTEADAAFRRHQEAGSAAAVASSRREVEDLDTASETKAAASYVLLGVGVGLAGGALWTWLTHAAPHPAATLRPAAGPGSAALELDLSF